MRNWYRETLNLIFIEESCRCYQFLENESSDWILKSTQEWQFPRGLLNLGFCFKWSVYSVFTIQQWFCKHWPAKRDLKGWQLLAIAVIRSSSISHGQTRVCGVLTQQEPVCPSVCTVTQHQMVSYLTLGSNFVLMLLLENCAFFYIFFFFFF